MFLIQCGISNLHQHPFGHGDPKILPSRLQKLGDEVPHDQRTAEGISGLSFFLSEKSQGMKSLFTKFHQAINRPSESGSK
jgi:hypothetical protein